MITATVSFDKTVNLPTGYTKNSLATITDPITHNYDLSIAEAGIVDPDPVVGVTALVAAIKSDFESNYSVNAMGLNGAATINANLTVMRVNPSNDRTSIYTAGTPSYSIYIYVEYEVV